MEGAKKERKKKNKKIEKSIDKAGEVWYNVRVKTKQSTPLSPTHRL